MHKKTLLALLIFSFFCPLNGQSQSPVFQSTVSPAPYHPPSRDKLEWQRLLLLLSSTYFHVVKEAQVDLDSSLIYASRSLGLSRLPLVAEGIDDPELLAQSQWVDQRDPQKGIRLLSQAKGKKHLELLVVLGAYYAFQPDSYHRYRDSVEYFLTRAIDESKTNNEKGLGRQALCLLGKMYVQGRDGAKGDSVFNPLIKDCENAGDKETEARALAYRGLYTAFSPATTGNRILYLQKAAEIYRELNHPEGEINALTDIGYLRVTTFEVKKAEEVFLKALQLEESIGYPYIHYNTDALGLALGFQGKFGEPFKYTLQTIRVAEANRDSIGWAYFYSRLATLYYSEGGRETESRKWFNKALDRFVTSGDAALYVNLQNMTRVMHDAQLALTTIQDISKRVPPQNPRDLLCYHLALSTVYMNLKQYDLAEKHATIADEMQKQSEPFIGPFRRSSIVLQLADIYDNKGEYVKSRLFYNRFLSDPSRGSHALVTELSVYKILIEIDSALHDAPSGLRHYRQYTQLLDSNFRVSKVRQAEELQVMYQTEEKENQITVLNQQAKLEQVNLEQAHLVRNVTIAGIVLVAIIAGLLYRQTRQKQESNNVITHKNELLQRFLTEKEWLLKEVHHRVKNNLQIVMSLLNSQSAYIENNAALTAIHDSQHRVHAMSLIHQKLYNSENAASIDMSTYIRELVSYLRDAFNTGQRIRFEMEIEPLELDVSQAVPVGLILNEAITNSIKYAFPDDRDGVIGISLSTTGAEHYVLGISDNGIGMPGQWSTKKPGSLGMSLMAGLSEDLDGKFSMENSNGTIIKVSFVHDLSVNRHVPLASSFIAVS